jgi:hypothetical protein
VFKRGADGIFHPGEDGIKTMICNLMKSYEWFVNHAETTTD